MTLGRPDVDGMLEEMTCQEFDEWAAYYELAPWGPERDSLHAGIVASAAIAPHCKKGHTPKASDFMHDFINPPKKTMKLSDMKAIWATAKATMNKPKRGK
jgi:hypothetical protein